MSQFLPINFLIANKKKEALRLPSLKSLLSDSNQRPRDYKSRALAN